MAMESELMSLISQLDFLVLNSEAVVEGEMMILKVASLLIQITSLVKSMDLDSLPKPESKLISLIKHIIYLGNSITNSDPEWEFISQIITVISLISSTDSYSDPKHEPEPELISQVTELRDHARSLEMDSELISLIVQMLYHARFESLGSLISLSPQLEVEIEEEKFRVRGKVQRQSKEKRECDPGNLKVFSLTGELPTHFYCADCNGEEHEECDKAPLEVKHSLHPKHSLQLVLSYYKRTRTCYCCDEDLSGRFYYCSVCDYAMNIACLEKPPVLSIDYPKWHEHTLSLFSRHTSLTCDVCALTHSRCPFYICPPCGFVVHQSCFNLPRVIKISRHLHRISFTHSFDQEDWPCGVCQRKINKDYGGYSCIKKGCSFVAHSKCATQSNVWDGEELEKMPEEIGEEEVKPFVTISDGIIEHFCHPHHHLRLVKYENRDYDENQHCQACIMPIYFGKFYSCMICDFILHEECAGFPRKIQHPIHPHMLTLVGKCDDATNYAHTCSACPWKCTSGFFYECDREECYFKLHVQCGTISEPLVHESHMHPLFLTSKPGEKRMCSISKGIKDSQEETFNCIKCDFSLCFECATLPQKVRYKHDKHLLTLSYGNETNVMMNWCEVCEGKIHPKERVYRCDEYCCTSLHMKCLIGKDLYMKCGSSLLYWNIKVDVLPNNQHMSRPFCSYCKKRCPYNIVFKCAKLTFCSTDCIRLY